MMPSPGRSLHVRPALGSISYAELTSRKHVSKWRNSMVTKAKYRRAGRFAEARKTFAVDLDDSEATPARRDTANRTLTVLKAALNWAHGHRLVEDDNAWRTVKPFRPTASARVRFLETAEQQRLLNTAEGALRDLIAAALMTGARFGELARLTVRDFDRTNGSVFIAESKSGKSRHVPLTPGGSSLFERLAIGKASTAALLTRETAKVDALELPAGVQGGARPGDDREPHAARAPALLCRVRWSPRRRSADRSGRGAWPFGYPDGLEALRAPGAVVCGRHDPADSARSYVLGYVPVRATTS